MELNFKKIVENQKNVLLCISTNYEILEFNKEAERFFGWKRDDVIGINFLNLYVPEEYHPNIIKKSNNILYSKNKENFVNPIILKDHTEIILNWNLTWLKNRNDQVYGVITFKSNIIKQAKIKHELKLTDINLFKLIEKAPLMITILDREGIILYFNQNDIDPDIDYIGKCIFDYHTPKNQKIIKKYLDLVFETSDFYTYEILVDFKGNDLWFETNIGPLNQGERKEFAIYFFQEITERKKAVEKLKISEEKYKNILQNITGMVYKGMPDWSAEFISGSESLSGYTLKELNSQKIKWINIIRNNDRERIKNDAAVLEEKPIQINQEYRILTKDGRIKWVSDHKVSLFNEEGLYLGVTGIVYDITKRKEFEKELIDSKDKYLEAYNRVDFYKDLFAHDINNILQNILMSAEYSQRKLRGMKENYGLEDINFLIINQVKRGSKLVSNIRTFSQIEEKHQNLKEIEIISNLNKSISNIEKNFKHVNISIKIKTEYSQLYIKANEFLQEIFDNILLNAIRHNNNPEIKIDVKLSKEGLNNKHFIKIEFIDNGIGIHDSLKEKIFQRNCFKQKRTIGMGLGLSLVEKIVDIYQGKIWVENKIKEDYSKGSNFIIVIPESIQFNS